MNFFAKLFGAKIARSINVEITKIGKEASPLYQLIVVPIAQPILDNLIATQINNVTGGITNATNKALSAVGQDNPASTLVTSVGQTAAALVNNIKVKL